MYVIAPKGINNDIGRQLDSSDPSHLRDRADNSLNQFQLAGSLPHCHCSNQSWNEHVMSSVQNRIAADIRTIIDLVSDELVTSNSLQIVVAA